MAKRKTDQTELEDAIAATAAPLHVTAPKPNAATVLIMGKENRNVVLENGQIVRIREGAAIHVSNDALEMLRREDVAFREIG